MSDEALAGNGARYRMCAGCHKQFGIPYGYGLKQGSKYCPECRRPPSAKPGEGKSDRRDYQKKWRSERRRSGVSSRCTRGEHQKCHISICTCDCHKATS